MNFISVDAYKIESVIWDPSWSQYYYEPVAICLTEAEAKAYVEHLRKEQYTKHTAYMKAHRTYNEWVVNNPAPVNLVQMYMGEELTEDQIQFNNRAREKHKQQMDIWAEQRKDMLSQVGPEVYEVGEFGIDWIIDSIPLVKEPK